MPPIAHPARARSLCGNNQKGPHGHSRSQPLVPGHRIRAAGLVENFLLIQTVVAAVFVVLCLISDWKKQRALHPIYSVGGTLLVLSWPLRAWIARTPAWESAGAWMARLTQGS